MNFDEAQKKVQTLKSRPGNETLLELYGLYKQGTEGDASGKRPGMLDVKGRAKYDAWAVRKGMAKDAAQKAYVELVERLVAKDG
jgi:acyl-CoA-binding protein